MTFGLAPTIEVTPTTELPIWPTFLDGNIHKYEPQQLEYLDGNLKIVPRDTPILESVIVTNNSSEAFNFVDNGEAILSTNNVDFSISGNSIFYGAIEIDLGESIQTIGELIVLKAKTPGFMFGLHQMILVVF